MAHLQPSGVSMASDLVKDQTAMLNPFITRLREPSGLPNIPAFGPPRTEICPPVSRSDGWRHGLREWISTGWPVSTQGSQPGELQMPVQTGTPLSMVRREFVDALKDIRTQQAGDLLGRIRTARSLRDLWHLRTEIYNLVATHRDETEAGVRLARLNRFFPQRANRSSTGALGQSATAAR